MIYSPGAHGWSWGKEALCIGGDATLGQDGRIYLLGGCTEAYTPATDRWVQLAYRLPTAGAEVVGGQAVTTGSDGRIYVLGGAALTPNSHIYQGHVTNTVQAYDPRTNRWTLVAPMPTAREALAAVTGADGRIYAIGGSRTPFGFQDSNVPRAVRTVEIYDPRTNRWSAGPSLNVARFNLGQ
jgi:N-acetylneuraminic acid mutarotase